MSLAHQPSVSKQAGGRRLLAGLLMFMLATISLVAQSPFTQLGYDRSGNLTNITGVSNNAPVIYAQPRGQVAPIGRTIYLSAGTFGSLPLQFQWQFNSNNISGATGELFQVTLAASNNFGAYRVVVSNSFGSITSSNALVQIDSDRDGLADAWETNYFTSITNRSGLEDYDQDGVAERDEFLEGTNPRISTGSVNPRIFIHSDFGEVFITPNTTSFTNNQLVTLTGVPNPGLQFLAYLGVPFGGGPHYQIRTNPAQIRLGTAGVVGSQIIRAVFGLPISESLDITNGWRLDQAGWYGQTNITHDGVDAIQSSRMFSNSDAALELTNIVLSSEGTITFWWKIDGTPNDSLQFYRNFLLRGGGLSGSVDWQQRTYYLPAGTNLIRILYNKISQEVSEYNGLLYAPMDAAWIDQVTYAPWPNPALDADQDGMRDIWELRYFDEVSTAANDDYDRDGVSNLDEFNEGSDPVNNSSYLPRLTIVAEGGTVLQSPNGFKFTNGTRVQLEAVPNPGNYFVTWAGAISGTNITNSVLMNRHQTVVAVFGIPLPEALETPSLNWTRGGDVGWYGQRSISRDGVDAAQSAPVATRQESWMETTISGPATITAWWKANSPNGTIFGKVFKDGVEQPGRISGTIDWQLESYYVDAGSHTLRWVYSNYTGAVSLTNGMWVDQITVTPGTIAPTIYEHPVGVATLEFQTVSFRVQAGGTPPLSYEWFHNGVSLGPPGTNATLRVASPDSSDAGAYSVRVSNAQGSVTSSNALLTILEIPPANDNFADRIALSGATAEVGYTHGAYVEPGEPAHAGISFGQSVWYSWIAPSNGNFRLRLTTTNRTDPLAAAIYRGNALSSLTPVAAAIGQTNGTNSASVAVPFTANSGTTYVIAVDTLNRNSFFTLSITGGSRPGIGAVRFPSRGGFGFSASSDPGANYVIQASVDLINWDNVASSVVPPSGQIDYTEATSSPRYRFYRLLFP